jgi:DNA polymerase sigma
MEILQFRDSVKEILTEMTPVKELIIEKISTIIKRAVPHSEVKVYGSHATKLCLPWSDIDLVIITQNRSSDGIYMNYPRSVLGQISSELRNEKENKWVSHVNYHDNATVPVVKVNCHVKDLINQSNNHMLLSPSDYEKYKCFLDLPINIDITQMTDHHNGLECVGVVQDYLKENEIIEPIMFVLKQLLKASNLNNPYSGGLSSYALFLMVVSFLQSHE